MKVTYIFECLTQDIETSISNFLMNLNLEYTVIKDPVPSNDELQEVISNAKEVKVTKDTLAVNDLNLNLRSICDLIFTVSDISSLKAMSNCAFAALQRCPQNFRCNDKDTVQQLLTDHSKTLADKSYSSAVKIVIDKTFVSPSAIRAIAYIKTKAHDMSITELKRLEYRIRSSKDMISHERIVLISMVHNVISSFAHENPDVVAKVIRDIDKAQTFEELHKIKKFIKTEKDIFTFEVELQEILDACIDTRKLEIEGHIDKNILLLARLSTSAAILKAYKLLTISKTTDFYTIIADVKNSIAEIRKISEKDATYLELMICSADHERKNHFDKLIEAENANANAKEEQEKKLARAKQVRSQYE